LNCERCESLLIAHLHRELDAETRSAVDGHLASCGSCARACCRLAAELSDIAFGDETDRPGPGVRESLRRNVEREFSPAWWKRMGGWFSRPVPAYGALALAALPLLYLVSSFVAERAGGASSDAARETHLERYDAGSALSLTDELL